MNKLFILSTFFFVISFTARAQTKEETQNWIREKLLKHTVHQGSGENYDIHRRIEFTDNGYIKIRFVHIEYKSYNNLRGGREHYTLYKIRYWSFPIWAIGTVTLGREGDYGYSGYSSYSSTYLNFNVDKYTKDYCTYTYSDAKLIPNNSTSRSHQLENYMKETKRLASSSSTMRIQFKEDPEEDFINRFNKAIQHLKTFYPKPVKKETF